MLVYDPLTHKTSTYQKYFIDFQVTTLKRKYQLVLANLSLPITELVVHGLPCDFSGPTLTCLLHATAAHLEQGFCWF